MSTSIQPINRTGSSVSTSIVPKKGVLRFNAEARLLQELGERLVAVPEVALVELIKNSYDADASSCTIQIDGETMLIEDDGHGMTFSQFKNFWMTIGTSHKAKEEVSPRYFRDLTGQKGIGRFAVRFLATKLSVVTIAYDEKSKTNTKLEALFDWIALDKNEGLSDISVPYQLKSMPAGSKTGTTLILSNLRHQPDFIESSYFKTQVLKILSPLQGLDSGPFLNRFKPRDNEENVDPGFRVILPGVEDDSVTNIAGDVLNNFVAKLSIRGKKNKVVYEVIFSGDSSAHTLELETSHNISNGFQADIRYFPQRKGLFAGKDVNGKVARSWVRENSGVSIVDRGFRVRPYGDEDDDWLDVANDANTNRRTWRTDIANRFFPISQVAKNDPALNPMINLPGRHQLVGAVFVASSRSRSTTKIDDLIPSTDREGFLKTVGFFQLKTFVRAGVEWIAHLDRLRGLGEKQKEAEEKSKLAKEEFREALRYVETLPTLTSTQRAKIVTQYTALVDKVDEVEEYERSARGKLSVMGAMGVLAGFLTHEASRLKTTLDDAARDVEAAAKKDPSLQPIAKRLAVSKKAWAEQLEYVKTFIDATQKYSSVSFKARPQVDRVVRLFNEFCDDRKITVNNSVSKEFFVPQMPVSVYSGILLNLFTNALKAVMAHATSSNSQVIEFRGYSDNKRHVVEVLDTGIGVPPSMRKRIFDPLFTTTSELGETLGTGMGLGLTLSRQLASEHGGTLELMSAPPGFATCFRLTLPFKEKNHE